AASHWVPAHSPADCAARPAFPSRSRRRAAAYSRPRGSGSPARREQHFLETLVLLFDAVQPRDDAVLLGIAEFVGGQHPRPETAGALEILAKAELPVM